MKSEKNQNFNFVPFKQKCPRCNNIISIQKISEINLKIIEFDDWDQDSIIEEPYIICPKCNQKIGITFLDNKTIKELKKINYNPKKVVFTKLIFGLITLILLGYGLFN